MEALGVLAGGLAHDFNNILTSIMGNSDLALKLVPEDGSVFNMLKGIGTASRNAADLCAQMLAFAGRGVISKQSLDCNSVIQKLKCSWQHTQPTTATIEFNLCQMPVFVEADKDQLNQVITNLVTNAAESLQNQAGKIVVATKTRNIAENQLINFQSNVPLTAGAYVCLTVTDTGCGMNAETQTRIFDPFFTTKFAGRGIGMAAVRGIIHRHQGHISLSSELGRGTTITVLLPQSQPLKKFGQKTQLGEHQRKTKCVLVVDDDAMVRNVLTKILISAGFEVQKAKCGQEAIDILQSAQQQIDCVLMDLSMPVLDGEATFLKLRHLGHEVPVVLNSGYAEQAIIHRIEGMGFAGVLQKPVSAKDLISQLNNILN